MIEVNRCPNCAEPTSDLLWTRSMDKRELIGSTHVAYYRMYPIATCPSCELLYAAERLPDEDIPLYYSEGHYSITHDLEYRYEEGLVFVELLKIFLKENNVFPSRQLDFGCAQGTLLNNVSWDGVGVEITPEYVEDARKRGVEIYLTLDEVPGSFDLISAVEVLEHFPYPARLLREFWQRLDVGGYILLTVPDVDNGHPQPISIRHLVAFTQGALENTGILAGFEMVSMKEIKLKTVPVLAYIGRKKE